MLVAGLAWLAPDRDPSLAVMVGYGRTWPIVIAIVAWSVYATFRGEPQSLAHEGRDVTVAFLLQVITMMVVGESIGSGPFGNSTVALLIAVPLLGMLFWSRNRLPGGTGERGIQKNFHLYIYSGG